MVNENETLFISQLTDGTKVELRINNFANQFNVTYQDIMSYLELKL
jgi:hypothetical protein